MKAPDPNSPIHGGYFRNKELALGSSRLLDGLGVWAEVIPDGVGFALVTRGRTLGLLVRPPNGGANGNGNGKSNGSVQSSPARKPR